jgi:DNA-binding transcriptional ArsR family regulator
MAASATGSRLKKKKKQDSLMGVLKHPLRVAILVVLNEKDLSPSSFVDRGYVPKEHYTTYQQMLSVVAYHCKVLEKAGLLEVIARIPRRGAVENVYRGVGRVLISPEEQAELTLDEKIAISAVAFQGIAARTERAISMGTFDLRSDRHLAWRAGEVDQKGWDEIMAILEDAFARAEQAREAARNRLNANEETEVIRITFAMIGYESPPLAPHELRTQRSRR